VFYTIQCRDTQHPTWRTTKEEWLFNGDQVVGRQRPAHHQEYCSDTFGVVFEAVEELYGTRYQSGSFSLINVGSGFHCLRSFSFFFSFLVFDVLSHLYDSCCESYCM